jgi:predicted DNA-binding WGR domain protein
MTSLERRDPVRNVFRFYHLSIQPNLFGEWSLIRTWGRIGQPGGMKIDLHATEHAAQAAMERKAWQERRRGYYG